MTNGQKNLPPLPPDVMTATRRLQFCAGHRVMGHESKCAHLHGHNYVGLISAQATLDSIGRVIDFGVLKDRVGGWIEQHWDHGFLFWEKDNDVYNVMNKFYVYSGEDLTLQKYYTLPYNPTAENMARYLLEISPDLLAGTNVIITKVRIWETENCYADAFLPPQ